MTSSFFDETNGLVQMFNFSDVQGSYVYIPELGKFSSVGVSGWSNEEISNFDPGYSGGDGAKLAYGDLSILGTSFNDVVEDGGYETKDSNITIETFAGDDLIKLTGSKSVNSIDAGSGNDVVYINRNDNAYLNYTKIDGGEGSGDWLQFWPNYGSGLAYELNTGNTAGFENVWGTEEVDTLTGDNTENILVGWGGADTISGGDGNDELYGYALFIDMGGSTDGNDILYGNAGDDTIVGGAGEDFLDGGSGADILTGDGGSIDATSGGVYSEEQDYHLGGQRGADTFVIRQGDGGSSKSDADIITDYQPGTDILGLADGLLFDQLDINQDGNDTVIRHIDGEYLTILLDVGNNEIDELLDFQPLI
jgi:Ca2+-binding RTX toxin-like protein